MPIMGGYEASILIDTYLKSKLNNEEMLIHAPLVFAMTADCSSDVNKKIKLHPFFGQC